MENRQDHAICIRQHIVVPEAQNTVAPLFEPARPGRVTLFIRRVLSAVHFNDELRCRAQEIDDVGADRLLAAKAESPRAACAASATIAVSRRRSVWCAKRGRGSTAFSEMMTRVCGSGRGLPSRKSERSELDQPLTEILAAIEAGDGVGRLVEAGEDVLAIAQSPFADPLRQKRHGFVRAALGG